MLVLDDIEVGPCLMLKFAVIFLDVSHRPLARFSIPTDNVSQYLLVTYKLSDRVVDTCWYIEPFILDYHVLNFLARRNQLVHLLSSCQLAHMAQLRVVVHIPVRRLPRDIVYRLHLGDTWGVVVHTAFLTDHSAACGAFFAVEGTSFLTRCPGHHTAALT